MTEEKKVRTTKAHLTIFKREFRKYQKLLGLSGWDVIFKIEELPSSLAQIRYVSNDCNATVVLNKLLEKGYDIKKTAKHEAVHLLLARYDYIASARYIAAEELVQANEEITVKLTDLIP